GAAGNVLVNDRRPSTKEDAPSEFLQRISSKIVARIEHIRVRVRDIDLYGRSEVVNVVLCEDAPATGRWEAFARQNFDHGPTFSGSISMSDRKGDVEYNVGVDAYQSTVGDPGTIRTFNGDGELVEIRQDDHSQTGPDFNGYLNASTWLGQTFLQINTRVGKERRDALIISSRISQMEGGEETKELIETIRRNDKLEVGLDAERMLQRDLLGRTVFLYSLLEQDPLSSQLDINSAGEQTRLQLQKDETRNVEKIARLELVWTGRPEHAVQLDVEVALNALDNAQMFTDDTGSGPAVVNVPGGNVRVEEERWNVELQDTWGSGGFNLNYGLGWERSTLAQSGDSNVERSFTFLKPRAVLSYAPTQRQQTQLRFDRQVSQLRFSDFVSAAVFEDGDLALGNPDLHPENTWTVELSHERRFGSIGVIKLTAFHNWIVDVVDLLPLSATSEAPGNIGNGRRWGGILATTISLDRIALKSAELGFRARWQDSSVTDPVTRENRVLSGGGGYTGKVTFPGENAYAFAVDYRQDLEKRFLSWGWSLAGRAERPRFKANELDVFHEGYELTAFIETTRWLGLNVSLEGENLLNAVQKRDRVVFTDRRSLSPVERRDLRDGTNGARLYLRVSGTF
ncbi:MAG: TonB-dependent receptor, partial [Woeseia sp.]